MATFMEINSKSYLFLALPKPDPTDRLRVVGSAYSKGK